MADIDLPQTQRAAKAAGVTRYFTGMACSAGHVAARLTANYNCVVCQDIRAAKQDRTADQAAYKAKNRDRIREESKRWREENPDYFKARYQANRAENLAKAKAWRENNRERFLAYLAVYRVENKERVQAQSKEWHQANPERARAGERAWRKENEERVRENFQKYYADNRHILIAAARARQNMQAQATPAWADLDKIGAIYRQAKTMTKETGIEHEVDHIIPINSKWVCGLHTHQNLQILTRDENRAKSNRLLEI